MLLDQEVLQEVALWGEDHLRGKAASQQARRQAGRQAGKQANRKAKQSQGMEGQGKARQASKQAWQRNHRFPPFGATHWFKSV